MAMEDTLRRFGEQFEWQPVVEHNEVLRPHKHYVVCGMGGSHLGAWLIKRYGHISNITIHRSYGLPELPQDVWDDALVILSSYSGTTEEVLDAGREALRRGLSMAAATTGGKLLEFAREHALPHVVIPETGLEPRMAIGFTGIAIARIMGNAKLEEQIREGGKHADATARQVEGKQLAERLMGKVPLVYASVANIPIAYVWKIKFNETAKIPSFCNVFPEMCHNELTGFDVVDATRDISARLHGVFLEDFSDHPRIQERMRVASEMLGERGIPIEHVALAGKSGFEKAFNGALLADWVTLELARSYKVPNPETPMVAEFKKRIGQ
jgi:glucose/mannose-6-phosphate isomerase